MVFRLQQTKRAGVGRQLVNIQGDEGKKFAEKTALPTLINATAGRLKLRIYSNSVSGTIWMKGYDPVEKAFVLYSAQLYGQKVYGLRPMLEQTKGTTVRE